VDLGSLPEVNTRQAAAMADGDFDGMSDEQAGKLLDEE